jgi:hypothetical protein
MGHVLVAQCRHVPLTRLLTRQESKKPGEETMTQKTGIKDQNTIPPAATSRDASPVHE